MQLSDSQSDKPVHHASWLIGALIYSNSLRTVLPSRLSTAIVNSS